MRLARANRTRQDQILGRGHPLAAGQRVDLRRADALGSGEIKQIKRFHLGEARLAQTLADDRLVPGRKLRAEHLLQIVFVRPVRVTRLAGEAFEGPGDPGELERPRMRDDEITGQRRAHAGTSASQPS
jgi:hypothetical protein